MDRVTAEAGGHATRLSSWRDPELKARFPAYGVVEGLHSQARALPAIPQYPALNQVLNAMMERALNEGQAKSCLREAEERMNQILEASR
jgi:multiple sugar transport system substrate-binding protein